MHNPVGPWAEANLLYIDASKLTKHLDSEDERPLVLFDVGLGAAANALAALTAFEQIASKKDRCRPLTIISFENDLSLLEFVVDQEQKIPYITGHVNVLTQLLREHNWISSDGLIRWKLHEGDFLKTIEHVLEEPDIVFFDPYSPGVNSEMWSPDAFSKLFQRTNRGKHPCVLYTYSRATHVRSAMLVAGFFVGNGPRSGLKDETTQAATCIDLLADPLGERWLLRWLRSHKQFQDPCDNETKEWMTNTILSHLQFADLYQEILALE